MKFGEKNSICPLVSPFMRAATGALRRPTQESKGPRTKTPERPTVNSVLIIVLMVFILPVQASADANEEPVFFSTGIGAGGQFYDAAGINEFLDVAGVDNFPPVSPGLMLWGSVGQAPFSAEAYLGGSLTQVQEPDGNVSVSSLFVGLDVGYIFVDSKRFRVTAFAGPAITFLGLGGTWRKLDDTTSSGGLEKSQYYPSEEERMSPSLSKISLSGDLGIKVEYFPLKYKGTQSITRLALGLKAGLMPAIYTESSWHDTTDNLFKDHPPDVSPHMGYLFATVGVNALELIPQKSHVKNPGRALKKN